MYSKSVYDVWQEITISSYSTNTIFLTVHNILHPTPKPTARRHRTTGDIPSTCVMLFDCWRLLNNESIPIPRKNAKEYSRIFPLFLTFSFIYLQQLSKHIAPVGYCTYQYKSIHTNPSHTSHIRLQHIHPPLHYRIDISHNTIMMLG